MEPPPYDSFADAPLLSSNNGTSSEPPAYDRGLTPPPIAIQLGEVREFTSEIQTGDGTPWAILTIQGDRRLSKTMPTVLEGSNLVGSVKFLLESSESIHAICILIRGELLKSKDGATTIPFFESKHTLWPVEGTSQVSTKFRKGDYNWPFSLPIPATFIKEGKLFRLPQFFSDLRAIFRIQYVAELRVVRGKLQPDDKVARTFGYFSMKQPGPPSALRQLAYQENSPLLGPTADHEGWTSQSASVKGDLFSSRQIELKFTLSLATPLSYTRQTCIPCALAIDTEDAHAFGLLTTPAACMVYLERTSRQNDEKLEWTQTVEPCGRAVFHPSTEGAPDYSARRLMGEIRLRVDLQPSFAIFGFQVEVWPHLVTFFATILSDFYSKYAVVVFPFQAAGFKPLDSGPVLRLDVEIVTRYAPGPRQKMYTAPSQETRNPAIDRYYQSLAQRSASVNFV
ncbi:hypothetical protein MVEN_01975500 [Mycena venus]|uniref:Arrestin-like N-terminal domain-containing protein n=1 Tax=Mycena venus TaxID=2733690 RepID=A0A8H6XDB8_9AGAR|nr:hypothetical protein MVEN_01975500 [Mycena venus]